MNLEKANKQIAAQTLMGSCNGSLAGVQREHNLQAGDYLTGDLELEIIFEFKPGTEFKH